jgi:signal transduction histidine kinase
MGTPVARVGHPHSKVDFHRWVLEELRCGVITIDDHGTATTLNRLAREILDLDHEGGELQPVAEVLSDHPRLTRILLDSLEMANPPNRAELDIRSHDARGRTIGFTVSPITDLGGVALLFKDLTSVEQQEERERLRDRLAALGQMAASLAHDIRNPLASIEVTASLLRRRLREREEDRALVEKITAEVQRLNRTITHGLEYARPINPNFRPVAIESILEESLSSAAARMPGSSVRVERRFADLPPAILDASLLRQVFHNLFANAYDAMPAGGTLSVQTSTLPAADCHEGPIVQVAIRDTGAGIDPESRDKLFFPFYTTKENGSGIGLSMARKLIECHHGTIDADNPPEGGARFRVRLPMSPTHVEAGATEEPAR